MFKLIYALLRNFTKYEEHHEFSYMMLDRLRCDCDYFLGYGNGCEEQLWANNINDHIAEMKRLYKSFPFFAKPEWITYKQIKEYEKQMKEKGESNPDRTNQYWDEIRAARLTFEDFDPEELITVMTDSKVSDILCEALDERGLARNTILMYLDTDELKELYDTFEAIKETCDDCV